MRCKKADKCARGLTLAYDELERDEDDPSGERGELGAQTRSAQR